MINCQEPFVVKSSAVLLVAGSLYILLPGVRFTTMSNLQRFKVIICQPIPVNAGTAQVFLSDGLINIPVNVETGNFLHADQIRCRKCYPMIFGNNPLHASLLCGVCPSLFSVPVVFASEVNSEEAPVAESKPEKEPVSKKV